MGDLSKHFSRSEFACKGINCDPSGVGNCGFDTVDTKLIEILEAVREQFGQPVRITSGCRCAIHNEREGGSMKSQHKLGRAADIVVLDAEPDHVADFLAVLGDAGGVGRYSTFSHVDSRTTDRPARWKG